PAWERSVLPARVAAFEPGLLDDLCLSGLVTWGRFSPPSNGDVVSVDAATADAIVRARRRATGVQVPVTLTPSRRRTAPTRAAPLALALRADLDAIRATRPDPESSRLSHAARDVAAYLAAEGASFSADIA